MVSQIAPVRCSLALGGCNRSRDGVWLIFRLKCVTLRENEAAENVPDPLVLREIYGHPMNGYGGLTQMVSGRRL